MQLVIITCPDFFSGEANRIADLFCNGLETLHLRKPQASTDEIRQLLENIPQQYYPRIVIHDAFSLIEEFPLKGIHLNRRHPSAPTGYGGNISRSCHTLDEVKKYKPSCNYVFLSPVYDSISKKGYSSGFTDHELQQAANDGIIDKKVIALGGIDATRLPELKRWNFGGAALLGDIWQHRDNDTFISHFLKLKAICDSLT